MQRPFTPQLHLSGVDDPLCRKLVSFFLHALDWSGPTLVPIWKYVPEVYLC